MAIQQDQGSSWIDEELADHLEKVGARFVALLDSRIHQIRMARDDAWSNVEESLFVNNATILTIQPQSENLFRVDQIVACYSGPANNLGLVEIGGGGANGGNDKFPVGNGIPLALGGKWLLENTDQRVISSVTVGAGVLGARGSGAAGFLYLALFGKEVPRDGTNRW